MGQPTGARLAIHWKDLIDHFECIDGRLLVMSTDNASSISWMTHELQSTLKASGIKWPALRNRIPCMAHIIQLASGAFMSSLGVKGPTKSCEAQECNQQFGENESIDIGKSQGVRKEGNAQINTVSAVSSGLGTIIEKVFISRYFESAETDLHVAQNAYCIDYADAWLSKLVQCLSNSQNLHQGTTCYECNDMLELDTGVAWVSLLIRRIHLRVA